jgi:hypothetical protein
MQHAKRRLDICVDPRLIAVRRNRSAGVDHSRKCGIGGDAKSVLPDCFGQRLRHAEPRQRQYRAPFRLDPIGGGIITRIGHREYAVGIAAQQQVDVDGHAVSDSFGVVPNFNCTISAVGL